jgi:hypothetical protein
MEVDVEVEARAESLHERDGSRSTVDDAGVPFEKISTGAGLYALDWTTGAPLWKGDVREILASHTEYAHDVRLSLTGGQLMLEGVESAGLWDHRAPLAVVMSISSTAVSVAESNPADTNTRAARISIASARGIVGEGVRSTRATRTTDSFPVAFNSATIESDLAEAWSPALRARFRSWRRPPPRTSS